MTKRSELEMAMERRMRAANVPQWAAEYRFSNVRKWQLDFAWPDCKIALETDGGTWSRGRHVRPKGYEDDVEKLNAAAADGWLVLRATGDMVYDGRALMAIKMMGVK